MLHGNTSAFLSLTLYKCVAIYLDCRQTSVQEEHILDEIKKATQSVSKNSVEQAAYFRAMAIKNNLNLDKYRQQVEQELKGENKGI